MKISKVVKPSLDKPTVGGSDNVWGDILNSTIDKIDKFNQDITDLTINQTEEISRLDREKIGSEDLESEVLPVLNNFIETDSKPKIDEYVNSVSKPTLDSYTSTKKSEIDSYITSTSKPSIDAFIDDKKVELQNIYNADVKPILAQDLQNHIDTVSKPSINEYTQTKITEIEEEGQKQLDLINDAVTGLPSRVDNLENNKLDKGGYTGTAQDLKNLIDNAQERIEKTTYEDIISMISRIKGGA